MKINEQYTIKLPMPNHDGIFDCMISKNHVFIRGGIENETVKIKITKKIKEGYVAQIIQVTKPSKYRIESSCPYVDCGGCSYNHITYPAQSKLKYQQIKKLYEKESITVHPLVMAEHPREYRNKCIFTFQKAKNQIKFGFYEENSHYVIDIKQCLNHDSLTMKILQEIKRLVLQFHIEIYDEDQRSGILRHVLIRRSSKNNQTLVCFVITKDFKEMKSFVNALVERMNEITTVVLNYNARKTSVVLSDHEKVVYGKGYILDELCGLSYKISANTFYQINHDQTEKLYQKAIELCNLTHHEKVLDMYCGIGTIGMSLAAYAKEVIGVEINSKSIKAAISNAKMNQITNIRFINQDATAFMKKIASYQEKVDIIIMDPPRSGSTSEFIKACTSLKPKKIIYISCNPYTQYQDLQEFRKYHYDTQEISLFDLFPYSNHVETIMMLSRL
ncbi:MAG: 23S rRNA (uracil(1939)-C(5))-methyltransferase RlmD [Traorella sp.]